MNRSENHLGLFAKFWEPGRVKTRLAATLGDELACELYQIFLFHLLQTVVSVTDQTTVVFSPANQQADFRAAIAPDWSLEPQSDGDLGDRMRNFFSKRLPSGDSAHGGDSSGDDSGDDSVKHATKVIAIGADCPQLPVSEIQTAFDLLDHNDVVIGPSTDGGYYLIGMRGSLAEVFDGIDWSTPSVLPQTIDRLNQHNKSHALLAARTDVDDEQDLQEMLTELSASTSATGASSANSELAEKISAALSKGRNRE